MTEHYPETIASQAPVEPTRKSNSSKIILVAVLGVIVAAIIGIGIAANANSASSVAGPTPIQRAVKLCGAPPSWLGDRGHSLAVSIDNTTSDAETYEAACLWTKLKMPDAVKSRLFDTASISDFQTTMHTTGNWPGYHATVSGSVTSETYTINIVVSES